MIFKMLFVYKLKRRFGPYMTESDFKKISNSMTEWQAFKHLLPIKSEVMNKTEARNELRRAIAESLEKKNQ